MGNLEFVEKLLALVNQEDAGYFKTQIIQRLQREIITQKIYTDRNISPNESLDLELFFGSLGKNVIEKQVSEITKECQLR